MNANATSSKDAAPALPAWIRKAPWKIADPLATARSLRTLLESEAAAGERAGRLTEPVARALVDSGMFGLMVPASLGGSECDPLLYVDTIEELSYADGSAGWVVLATTFGTAAAATWLGDAAVERMFDGEGGFICAGQLATTGTAERVEGGYRVRGRFQFGSGSNFASFMMGAFLLKENGAPVLDEKGRPAYVWAFLPRSGLRFVERSWEVMGLSATASVDYEAVDQFVAEDFVVDMKRARRGGPVYEIGVSIAHISWSLGVAMRAMDEIRALAARKRRPARATLIDQPTFQRDYAENLAALEACRALVRSIFGEWHEAAKRGEAGIEAKARGRMAACWATKTTNEIGRFAHLAAGSDGIRNHEENRIQRCFRDLHAGSIHKHVDDNVMIDCGAVLLGVASPDVEL